jgi:hypothetical protein
MIVVLSADRFLLASKLEQKSIIITIDPEPAARHHNQKQVYRKKTMDNQTTNW